MHAPHFTLYVERLTAKPSRLGITVSKKIGGAVQRNRVKRLIREFFRLNRENFPDFIDLSIVAKPGASDLSYRQVFEELAPLLHAVGRGVQ